MPFSWAKESIREIKEFTKITKFTKKLKVALHYADVNLFRIR